MTLIYNKHDLKDVLLNAERAIDFYDGSITLNPKVGFKWALAAAKLGDPRNMVNVAYSYAEGIYVEKDMKKAVNWLRKAMKFGIPEAFYNMAKHFENGEGVKRNYILSFRYYKKSAELGYGEGILAVGWCYENGFGIKRNLRKAIDYYTKAAKLGEELAYLNLGLCYLYGKGRSQSTFKAINYLSDLKLKNNLRANILLRDIYSGEDNFINFTDKKKSRYYLAKVKKIESSKL